MTPKVRLLTTMRTMLSFVTAIDGLGYSTFLVEEGKAVEQSEELVSAPVSFENEMYRITLEPDGTFSSLAATETGEELLDSTSLRGNMLMAMESAELERGPKPDPERLGRGIPRESRHPPGRGQELRWERNGEAKVQHTALGMTFRAPGRLGKKIRANATIRLYHQLPYIDVRWDFEFESCSIGTFFDDETKLRVQMPLAFEGDIYHDIPFGCVRSKAERPFFPASWVDISDGSKGLAYLHQGTPKHWVSESFRGSLTFSASTAVEFYRRPLKPMGRGCSVDYTRSRTGTLKSLFSRTF